MSIKDALMCLPLVPHSVGLKQQRSSLLDSGWHHFVQTLVLAPTDMVNKAQPGLGRGSQQDPAWIKILKY